MYDIFFDVQVNASKEEVFQAISNPDLLINWWPLRCSGKPKVGEHYNFFFTPEYDWYGQVLKYVQDNQFHIQMTSADEDWEPTSFGFDLIEHNGGTQLEFWHINWPERNHHFRKSAHCWALLLQDLKTYVEDGTIIPFEKRA